MKKRKKRIGLLGGTFDPIHRGHMTIAMLAKEELKLDEIWFLPAPVPPHKIEDDISDFSHRFSMIELAIRGMSGYVCSDIETKTETPSYTANTLEALSSKHPSCDWYFIIGADSLFQIKTWYHPEKIFSLATLVVAHRNYTDSTGDSKDLTDLEEESAFLRKKYRARIYLLASPAIDISSTQIRKMVMEGRDIAPYVPGPVSDYIVSKKMYLKEKKKEEKGEPADES